MAEDISVRLSLTGEKQFSAAIKNINAAVKESNSSLKLADTQLAKTGNSMEGLTKKGAALEKAITSQQNKMAVLAEQISNASERYGSSSVHVLALQNQYNEASIALTKLNSEFQENKQTMQEVESSVEHLQTMQENLNAELAGTQDTLGKYNQLLDQTVQEYGENSEQANALREDIERITAVVSDLTGEITTNNNALSQAEAEARKAAQEISTLKPGYEDAGKGAVSFADIVKGSAIGNLISSGIQKALGALKQFAAEGAQSARDLEVSEMQLGQVMRNTIGATEDQVESIRNLIEQQEQLGVVSKNAQTAAAQELATYTSKTKSLEKLIPVMNDMIAQQYGVNASNENAVSVATALGKTLDGQVGSLSRWGYTFSEQEQRILQGNNELRKLDVLSRVITGSVGGMNRTLADTTEEGRLFRESLQLGDVQEQFGRNVDSIKNNVLIGLLPALTEVTSAINDTVAKNGDALANLGKIIGDVLKVVASLIGILSAMPPDLLMIIGIIVLVISTVSKLSVGIKGITGAMGAAGGAVSGMGGTMDMLTIKIIAVVAAVAVLLYLILSLKEGSDNAARSMQSLGSATGSFSNEMQQATRPRGYATGTKNARRGLAWVGENGPELVSFHGGEIVYTAAQSRRLATTGAAGSASGNQTYGDYHDNRQLIVGSIDETNRMLRWWKDMQQNERKG